MSGISDLRRRMGLTQGELAARAGTSQPTIAAYESGRKSPTVRTVERVARTCGLEARLVFVPPLTREERRSLYLHMAISRRIVADPEAALARARRNLQTMRKANSRAAPLLQEWRRILDDGVGRVLEVLADPGEHARELRQVTPFAGLLTTGERHEVYHSFRVAERRVA